MYNFFIRLQGTDAVSTAVVSACSGCSVAFHIHIIIIIETGGNERKKKDKQVNKQTWREENNMKWATHKLNFSLFIKIFFFYSSSFLLYTFPFPLLLSNNFPFLTIYVYCMWKILNVLRETYYTGWAWNWMRKTLFILFTPSKKQEKEVKNFKNFENSQEISVVSSLKIWWNFFKPFYDASCQCYFFIWFSWIYLM